MDCTAYWMTNCDSQPTSPVTRSCRFALYNIGRIRPFLTREAAQLLVQTLVISRLNYCNSLLAGLPASQLFKTIVLTYKAVNETAPTHLQALVRPHVPARALRATTSAHRPVPPSLRANKGRTAKSQFFCLGATMVERPPC
ncbi:hypothetical protein N1851_014391 [Merluccius polli]|uniref:Uncharacterized protein n=1 Tax=Merluccius polli TaxID=89951 RepID=A0AA47MTF5_MERPO|nr:hypothetical protein N1851_014391 [Merluccius polli]